MKTLNKNIRLLCEICKNWPSNLLGINVHKTLQSCWQSLFAVLQWTNSTLVISKWGPF